MKPSYPLPPPPPLPPALPELPPFERFLIVLEDRVAPLVPRPEAVAALREASSLRLLPRWGLLVPPDKPASHVLLVVKGLLRTFEGARAVPEGPKSTGKGQAKGVARAHAAPAAGGKDPARAGGKSDGKDRTKGPPQGGAKGKTPLDEGTERTRGFFEVGAVLADAPALLSGRASGLGVQAVEEAAVLRLPWEALRRAANADHALERFCRLLVEAAVLDAQDSLIRPAPGQAWSGVGGPGELPVEVRYRAFLEERPELAGRLSPRLLASYLGISTEALAQLRSRRFRTPGAAVAGAGAS